MEQGGVAYAGYHDVVWLGRVYYINEQNYLCYTRNSYNLKFYNYNAYVDDKGGSVQYEAPLSSCYFEPEYPANLEANAYGIHHARGVRIHPDPGRGHGKAHGVRQRQLPGGSERVQRGKRAGDHRGGVQKRRTEKQDSCDFSNRLKPETTPKPTDAATPAPTGSATPTGVEDNWPKYLIGAAVILAVGIGAFIVLRRKDEDADENNN